MGRVEHPTPQREAEILRSSLAYAEAKPSIAERSVQHYAALYRVPPDLIAAFIDVESRWNPHALSKQGSHETHAGHRPALRGDAPFDAEQKIAAGVRYVTTLMWEFHGDLRRVAAAYYAGDRWVSQKHLNYRNPDVIAYVQALRRHYMMRKPAAARPTRR